jgi:hypothetical protein
MSVKNTRRGRCHGAAACWHFGCAVAEGVTQIIYSGYRFPPEIIQQAIWLYLRFTLSFRDVEDLLVERGVVFPTRRSGGE